jgi:hypothetical protein
LRGEREVTEKEIEKRKIPVGRKKILILVLAVSSWRIKFNGDGFTS